MDLASGFYQIEMEKDSVEITSFISREGLFQFLVLLFGICSAPPAFCRLIDVVLAGLRYDTCMAYVDDIVIYSSTIDEHLQKLKSVFERLKQKNLILKPSKCNFLYKEIKVLEFIVNS